MPNSHLYGTTDASQRHNSIRYVHYGSLKLSEANYSVLQTRILHSINVYHFLWKLKGAVANDNVVTAWSIVFFSWLHTIAHWNNFAQLAIKQKLGFVGWLMANFVAGPGWTGYIMLICLMAMVLTAVEKPRRANFERFW